MKKSKSNKIEVNADKIETPVIMEETVNNNEDLKKVIEETKENLIIDVPEKKEKRGRPKGSTNKKTVTDNRQDIILPLSPVINIIIARLPNPIPLTESEKNIIDETGSKVINKYMNDFEYSEEILLFTVLIGVIYPRTKKEKTDLKNDK